MTKRTALRNCFMLALSSCLAMSAVAGCSISATTGDRKPVAQTPPAQLAQADTVALADKPATFIYASAIYTFSVPVDMLHLDGYVTALAVPGGILWMTPAGWPDADARPLAEWSLWLTPPSPTGGSLWTGAQRLQTFIKEQAPSLLGVMDGYALVSLKNGTQEQILRVGLKDGQATPIAQHAPGVVWSYGYGVYAWQEPDGTLHVVKLTTGEEQVTALPLQRSLSLAGGGVVIDGKIVSVPLISKPSYSLPAGYKWIEIGQSQASIAVPETWIVKPIPGGSSTGVSATNPDDPNQKVMLVISGCAGCQDPGVLSPQRYKSWSSPLVDAAKGETDTWVDDHTVTYTMPPDQQNPYPTYGMNRTFTQFPGNQWAKINLPEEQRDVATIILDSALARPWAPGLPINPS